METARPTRPDQPEAAGPTGNRATAARRRARQQEIVASTRELFDARGMRSANIDDISKAVGINRAIIYRHFVSKEELFALALAEYLAELDALLDAVDPGPPDSPRNRLAALSGEFARYCLRYPAFVDCALALLGRPATDLLAEISDAALQRLEGLMGAQLGRIAAILRIIAAEPAGDPAAEPAAEPAGEPAALDVAGEGAGGVDVDLLANALYMQALGLMHLARSGVVLRPGPGGSTTWVTVDHDRIVDLVRRMTLAVALP